MSNTADLILDEKYVLQVVRIRSCVVWTHRVVQWKNKGAAAISCPIERVVRVDKTIVTTRQNNLLTGEMHLINRNKRGTHEYTLFCNS